jgi:hypothetical protein
MLELHRSAGAIAVCDGECPVASVSAAPVFAAIGAFLRNNPREVLTLVIWSYVAEGLGARSKLSLPIRASDGVVPIPVEARAANADAGELFLRDNLLCLIATCVELCADA